MTTSAGPDANGCHATCTDGWIRGRGEWVQCPNHRMRNWPIGPMPPPPKTEAARAQIARAKAAAARGKARGDQKELLRDARRRADLEETK